MVSFRSHLAITRAAGERSNEAHDNRCTDPQIPMTNDQIRRNDEIPMTKPTSAQHGPLGGPSVGFHSSCVIRLSSFGLLSAFLSVFGGQPPAGGENSVL